MNALPAGCIYRLNILKSEIKIHWMQDKNTLLAKYEKNNHVLRNITSNHHGCILVRFELLTYLLLCAS